MERRNFFSWIGKISLAIGLGYMAGQSHEIADDHPRQVLPERCGDYRMRMNGRACHDFRMISNDRSMRLDREIFFN